MRMTVKMVMVVILGILVTAGAAAQFDKPEDAIRYRKSVMVLIGQHFKQMGAVVKGKAAYNGQAFAANADLLKTLATLPWEAALVPGTDKGDTTLSASVFSKSDAFKETAAAFEAATAKLAEASRGGNLDAAKTEFSRVAKNCKACHDQFRK